MSEQNENPAVAAPAAEPELTEKGLKRRTLIKGAVAAAGIAGFPYVHAQEKIVLRYLGTAVNQSSDIAKKFKEDTGIEISTFPSPRMTSPSASSPSPIRSISSIPNTSR